MRDFARGLGYLVKGQRWVTANRGRVGLAIVPALIALALYVAVLVVLGVFAGDIVYWATPFAAHWSAPWPGLLRGFLVVLLLALGLLLSVVTFTAVTLAIGQPFYEALSERVDRSQSPEGRAPEPTAGWREQLWVALRDSVLVVIRAAVCGAGLLMAGFLPVLGQTVVPVLGIGVTGFFLAQELTAVAMQRRGISVRGQLQLLRSRRMLAWGFGIPLAIAYLVPFVAIALMPGAVAGATLMTRELVGDTC